MVQQNTSTVEKDSSFSANVPHGDKVQGLGTVDSIGNNKDLQFIKGKFIPQNAVIKLFPNPLSGNKLNIQFSNLESGTYSIRLINNSGSIIINKSVQHQGGASIHTMFVAPNLSRGMYVLQIVNKNNQVKFVQQIVRS